MAACTYQTSFPSLLCIAPASASSPRLGFAAHDIIKSSKTDHSHCDCSRTKLRINAAPLYSKYPGVPTRIGVIFSPRTRRTVKIHSYERRILQRTRTTKAHHEI